MNMTLLIILNIAAQAADYVTTRMVLRSGGKELNPFSLFIMQGLSYEIWGLMKLGAAIWMVTATWPLMWPGLVLAGLGFAVAVHNWRIAK